MDTQQTDPLSATFAALADPTRRAILARLAEGEASVKDLSAPFDMSQPAISKHLRVLERAGLIEQGRQAQWRPRRLRAGPLRDIADWVDQYRRHWEESFERLDAYLRELQDSRSREMETTMTATRIDRGSTETTTIYSEGGDLVFERTFDAPRERVWKAFTDPDDRPALVGPARLDDQGRRRWTSGPGGKWRYVSSAPRSRRRDLLRRVPRGRPRRRATSGRSCSTSRASGRRAGRRPSSSRRSTARRRSPPSGTWARPRCIEGALATGMVGGAIETWDRLAALLAEG